MSIIYAIPDDTVDLEKVYYHSFYVLLNFNKEYVVDIKDNYIYMKSDTDYEDMRDVVLDD